jgi:hypothetical protein
MAMSWKAGCWLGVLGLAGLALQPAQAFGDGLLPGVKIDAGVNAWFKIYTPQNVAMKNLAPWYTYFPYDPAMMGPPAANMYPTWPNPFPPPQALPAPQKMMGPAGNGQTIYPGQPQSPPGRPQGQVAGHWQAPPVQPVGYFHSPVPSYWFAR